MKGFLYNLCQFQLGSMLKRHIRLNEIDIKPSRVQLTKMARTNKSIMRCKEQSCESYCKHVLSMHCLNFISPHALVKERMYICHVVYIVTDI